MRVVLDLGSDTIIRDIVRNRIAGAIRDAVVNIVTATYKAAAEERVPPFDGAKVVAAKRVDVVVDAIMASLEEKAAHITFEARPDERTLPLTEEQRFRLGQGLQELVARTINTPAGDKIVSQERRISDALVAELQTVLFAANLRLAHPTRR